MWSSDGVVVVAANAPAICETRKNQGEASLPTDQPRSLWFDLPSSVDDALYRKKFFDLMVKTRSHDWRSIFLAQRIWDVSMGKSLADLRASGGATGILLVGGSAWWTKVEPYWSTPTTDPLTCC